MRRTLGAVCLVVVLCACRESGGSTETANPSTTAETAAAASVPKRVAEQEVVPYERADVGAIEVRSIDPSPTDWFDVLKDGKRAFSGNPLLLNRTLDLPPGMYIVDVNRTVRPVTLEPGKKTILWTGELVVEGEPSHAYWYPMQNGERKLSSNPSLFNSARAFFPGTYTVYIYRSVTTGDELLGDAEVKAGERTVLKK